MTCSVNIVLFSISVQKTVSGRECALPFVYNNVIYTSCTKEDSNYYWCSHDGRYDEEWDYCDFSDTYSKDSIVLLLLDGNIHVFESTSPQWLGGSGGGLT